MVKITDMVEIHDGVALLIGRHDQAYGGNISAEGAMYAYIMGKFAPEYFRIDPPQHIYHSPISRARNTAKMHRIAQQVTSGVIPDISYDERLHEKSIKYDDAADEAINQAENMGYKTIEIITHSSTPLAIAEHFGANLSGNLGYGGMIVLKANSWEDMRQGHVTAKMVSSSKDLAEAVLGKTQLDILECMVHPQNINSIFEKNSELAEILKKAEIGHWESADKRLNAVIKAKQQETAEWALKALAGEDVESEIRPDEFMEIYDSYVYWAQNLAVAVNIFPENEQSPLQSRLMEKLLPLSNTFRGFGERYLGTEDGDLHPIYQAYANRIMDGRLSADSERIKSISGAVGTAVPGYTDIMEPEKLSPEHDENDDSGSHDDDDHPILHAALAAMMRRKQQEKRDREEKVEVATTKEVKAEVAEVEPEKVETEKAETEQVEAEKVEEVKTEPEKVEVATVEEVKAEPEKVEVATVEEVKAEPEKIESEAKNIDNSEIINKRRQELLNKKYEQIKDDLSIIGSPLLSGSLDESIKMAEDGNFDVNNDLQVCHHLARKTGIKAFGEATEKALASQEEIKLRVDIADFDYDSLFDLFNKEDVAQGNLKLFKLVGNDIPQENIDHLYDVLMESKPKNLMSMGANVKFSLEQATNLMEKYPDFMAHIDVDKNIGKDGYEKWSNLFVKESKGGADNQEQKSDDKAKGRKRFSDLFKFSRGKNNS